jgi:hypothetical protein
LLNGQIIKGLGVLLEKKEEKITKKCQNNLEIKK